MTRTRNLQEPESDKLWSTKCEGNRVIIGSGKVSAVKLTEKVLDDDAAALLHAEKEEWSRLKKGFLLSTPEAGPGEPSMHRYLGRGFTGAQALEALDGGRGVCNQYDEGSQHDRLFFFSASGSLDNVLALPEANSLVWSARFSHPAALFLLVDHQIYCLSLVTREFEKLTERNRSPVSFITLSGRTVAWFEEPEIVLSDTESRQLIRRIPVIPEKYANHTFQMKAELSPDSLTLAYCCKSGEINLVDVQTGEHRALIQGDFQMVKKMAFSPDGRYLIVQEAYGAWGIYCFDLQMAEPRAEFPHMKDLASGDFAVDGLGNLAVSRREWIEIFDLADMKLLLRFRADHVVKSCTLRFIGTQLCVRTDAACLSLYPF